MYRDDPERPRSSLAENNSPLKSVFAREALWLLYTRSDSYKCNHDVEVAADETSMQPGVRSRDDRADWSCAFFSGSRGARSNRVLTSTRPEHPWSDSPTMHRLPDLLKRSPIADVCACERSRCTRWTRIAPATATRLGFLAFWKFLVCGGLIICSRQSGLTGVDKKDLDIVICSACAWYMLQFYQKERTGIIKIINSINWKMEESW